MRCDREDAHQAHEEEGFDTNNCSITFACKGVEESGTATLEISSIPKGHLIVGHATYLKLLDETGDDYWGMRSAGMNAMETIGCATDMLEEAKNCVLRLPTERGDDL